MRVIYPKSILEPRLVDEMYRDEASAFENAGHDIHRVDTDKLDDGPTSISPTLTEGPKAVYRGWMLKPKAYGNLVDSVHRGGGTTFTSREQYVLAHYLPNWYPILKEFTPETVVLDVHADLVGELERLGWGRYFVKDYVKSLKTSLGSIVEDPSQVGAVVAEMEKYRGFIEGGLCIRRVENFLGDSEVRYFVINGRPVGPRGHDVIPDCVKFCADNIRTPFFSVDVALRDDGVARVVEIGDGQVSDLVGWDVADFVSAWKDVG